MHGWVGRRAFQRDRHDLCVAPTEDLPPDEEETAEKAVEEDDEREPVRRGRRRRIPPKKTLALRRITQVELTAGRIELAVLGADEPYERPKKRGDCAQGPRPCPYVSCKHNLYLDVSNTGSITFNFPHLEPEQMSPDRSCALDLADRNGMTLEEIAAVTNLTRERIRQIEVRALSRRARAAALEMGLSAEDAAAVGARYQAGPGADLCEAGFDGEGEIPSDVVMAANKRRRDG